MISTITSAWIVVATALGAGPSNSNASEGAAGLPTLNRKVVDFARGHLGEKIGDGQCTALASAALKEAGARRFRMGGTGGDYVWGRPVGSFREALPGDVVQFRDAVFRGRRRLSGGRFLTWHQEYPHHTAVVAEVRDAGKTVVLLHQNVGPDGASADEKQVVSETVLRVDGLRKGGQVWIYRPVGLDEPDPPSGPESRSEPAPGGASGRADRD